MAQSDEDRDKLVAEMKKRSHLKKILNQLEGEEDDDQTEVGLKEGAAKAKNGQAEEAMDTSVTSWEVMNLEEMAFTNGSHFMANKRCQLPEGSYR